MQKHFFFNLFKILILIIFFFIIYYFQLGKNIKKHVINNWNYYKCQPYIIPFAGFFRKPEEPLSFWKFTIQNFQKCKWVKIKLFFSYFIKPLQYILKIITKIISDFRQTLNIFRVEAKKIRGVFKTIVEDIAEKLSRSHTAIQFYQSKMQNIIKQQLAVLQLMMYFAESMKMTLTSLVNGPIIEMVKFLPAFGIALIALVVICLACMFGGPFTKMVACPICLICFNGNSKCIMNNQKTKRIRDISIGEELLFGGEVTSTFIFDLKDKNCDMYNYSGIEVSGSHIVFDNKRVTRIESHPKSKSIIYNSRYIYCLNTENRYILMKNKNGNSILFSDFYESNNIVNNYKTQKLIENKLNGNYLYDFKIYKDTLIHNYEWGFSSETLIKMNNGIYKRISEINMGDTLYKGGKVYGLVKHCSKNKLMFQYKNNLISGTQLVQVDNKWKRVYSLKNISVINNYNDNYIYHLVCDNHLMYLFGDILTRDYLELNETDSIFDIILEMNLTSVKTQYLKKNNRQKV